MPNIDVRPEVAAFALLMEAKLRKHDRVRGQSWKRCDEWWLKKLMGKESRELTRALKTVNMGTGTPDPGRVGSEAADVANFAMMIADVCGALGGTDG